jgi:teichuronic acid biosynthesis glycosyltransferase TuaC
MSKRDLNVLVVSRLYPRPTDPVLGIFVEEEAVALSRLCQVKVVSPCPWFPPLKAFERWYSYSQLPSRETRRGVEVLRPRVLFLPRNFLFSLLGWTLYLSLRRCIREIERDFPIDLIHAHTVYPDGFGAVLLGHALRKPTVITAHGGDVTVHLRRGLVRRLGCWALSNADHVIVVSSSLRRVLVQGHGMEAEKVTVIPNGVDVARFAPAPRSEARARLGLHAEGAKLLYVGAIAESKGIAYLLRAIHRLRHTSAWPLELILVGEGEYERAARALVAQLGIADAVTFAGKRPNDEIPLWMNATDLLVLPSLSEGFGVVLVEAMACGKPVVATTCGGPEDIVTPQTGILVPPADNAALSEALLEVLADGERFHPQAIREHALDTYGYDRVTSRIMEVYAAILGRRTRAGASSSPTTSYPRP